MRLKTYYLSTLILLLGASCQKEVDQFIPDIESVVMDFGEEFGEFLDTLTYEIDLDDHVSVYTPIGTEFIFKLDMFEYTDGTACDCERVTVRILELADKRDYMIHQAPTISNGSVLISAGAYHVAAFYKGQPLRLTPEEQLCFTLPDPSPDDKMKLFYGETIGDQFNWRPADQIAGSRASLEAGQWETDRDPIVGYQCFSDRLDWINVDKIASDGPPNPVCIALEEEHSSQNTVIFSVLKEQNSILNLYYDDSSEAFCLSNIPIGSKVIFLGVHKTGKDAYEFAIEEVVIKEGDTQRLDFAPKGFDEIKAVLKSL